MFIVDPEFFKKGDFEHVAYSHNMKEKIFHFYNGDGKDIVSVIYNREDNSYNLVAEKREPFLEHNEINLNSYFRVAEEYLKKIESKYEYHTLLVDLITKKVVYDISRNIETGFFSKIPPTKVEWALAYYIKDGKKVLCHISNLNKSLLGLGLFISQSNDLLKPSKYEEVGCELVFDILCTRFGIAPKHEFYISLREYAHPLKEKPQINSSLLDNLVKMVNSALMGYKLSMILFEEVLPELKDKTDVEVDIKDITDLGISRAFIFKGAITLLSKSVVPFTARGEAVLKAFFKTIPYNVVSVE